MKVQYISSAAGKPPGSSGGSRKVAVKTKVASGLSRLHARIRDVLSPAATVLMYHRVARVGGHDSPLAVAPEHFEAQMAHLRESYNPISLLELARAMRARSIPRGSVVVTFDDGYLDNLENALPVLQRFAIPATIFVATAAARDAGGFWWDELDRMILGQGRLPEKLVIITAQGKHEWLVAEGVPRMPIRREVNAVLRKLSPGDREEAMMQLRRWASNALDDEHERRAMAVTELRRIQQSSLIELGAHTDSHPLLSTLSYEDQYAEIVGGRDILQEMTGRPIRCFAYPYGDYNSVSTGIVAAAGFEIACGTQPGRVTSGTLASAIPRQWIGDWDGAEFRARMQGFQRH
jgi:peptidoglycan/xylan/chitin deacetylase (PgdA/CDA1 family)